MMKCRMDIVGRKLWQDDNNAFNTRPTSVNIILYRDGIEHDSAVLASADDGVFRFPCQIIWKNASEKYIYTVDEITPDGYSKKIKGYNITNTLNNITITVTKTFEDNDNIDDYRPSTITVFLFQNGIELTSQQILSPIAPEKTVIFTFEDVPYADAQGVPYVYTVKETEVEHYETTINGFDITNTLAIVPFSPQESMLKLCH